MNKITYLLIELTDSEEDKQLLELLEKRVKIVEYSETTKEVVEKIGNPTIYFP